MLKSLAGRVRQSETGQRRIKRLAIDLLSLVALTLLFRSMLGVAVGGDGDCANTGVTDAYQPYINELANALEAVASHNLDPTYYEDTGWIYSGVGQSQVPVPATFPCVILKAIAYIESTWHQAATAPRGTSGYPLMSYSCGYGVMQITSPMVYWGKIDPVKQQRIAREYRYNVSYGGMMLGQKWNWTPLVGSNDPNIAEDWYYAVWAYNNFSWKNNPNNPTFPADRPPFDGSQPHQWYPYQEMVWGYAANPPPIDGAPRWSPVSLTLPPRIWITSDPNATPDSIPDPEPTHSGACSSPPPPTPTPTPPILRASAATVAFLAEPGKSASPQTVLLTGINSSSINWSIQPASPGWLSASPPSGSSVPAYLTISANTSGLTGGWQPLGTVTIRNLSNTSQQDIVINASLYIGPLRKLLFPMILR